MPDLALPTLTRMSVPQPHWRGANPTTSPTTHVAKMPSSDSGPNTPRNAAAAWIW